MATALAVAAVGTATTGLPAGADTSTASCTENGITWGVEYTRTPSGLGDLLAVTALTRTDGSGGDPSAEAWELRWDHPPQAFPPAAASFPPSFNSAQGTLDSAADIDRPLPDYLSPRLVVPDGSCTVYLSPFTNMRSPAATPAVAVLGDDLVHQLNDSQTNQQGFQGRVEVGLADLGIRSEIEGHAAARLSPPPGATGLTGSSATMGDEFRGLLEHGVDSFVLALGRNDATYIAGGADAAARNARRDEVYAGLTTALSEYGSRAECVTIVTPPQNASTVDPDYAWAAQQVNNYIRFVTGAAAGPVDRSIVVDFGARAASHGPSSAEPWFAADGITLAGAGLDAYTAAIVEAGQRCTDEVVLWGAPGTLGSGVFGEQTRLATGQRFSRRPVESWDFGTARAPWFSTIADDGTLAFMVGGTGGNVFAANGEGMAVTTFDPDAGDFQTVPIETDRGVEVPEAACPATGLGGVWWNWCDEGELFDMGGWVGDVATLADGDSFAFTGYQAFMHQDLETEGQYPVLGVVSRGAGGAWQIAEGPDGNGDGLPDWRNAWSDRELVAATIAAANPSVPGAVAEAEALADDLCPEISVDGTPVAHCGPWVNEIAVLPESGDLVVAMYGTGKIGVIDVGEPDAAGRVTARIAAVYTLPPVDDPVATDPAVLLSPAPREVQADPSSSLGDERFALQNDFAPGVIEFSYDASAPADERVRPVSAPVVNGEVYSVTWAGVEFRGFVAYGAIRYDHAGNLWLATDRGRDPGVKVYVNTPQGRKITRPECLEYDPAGNPIPLADYTSTASGYDPIWGKVCAPDYNIRHTGGMGNVNGLEEDPVTHDIAVTDWAHGIATVIRPSGSGDAMTFEVGNMARTNAQQTSTETVDGPCAYPYPLPGQDDFDWDIDSPGQCEDATPAINPMHGPVDAQGRMWLPIHQTIPRDLDTESAELKLATYDQWIYSYDLRRLRTGTPQQLTVRSGATTLVEAEATTTVSTSQTSPGIAADVDVVSSAPVRPCIRQWIDSCTDPETGVKGGGFELGEPVDADGDGHGVAAGTTASYTLVAPKAGTYDVVVRASDRGLPGVQTIVVTIDGTPTSIEVTALGTAPYAAMKDHPVTTVELPAGAHTLTVSAPQGGWELDWISFTRT